MFVNHFLECLFYFNSVTHSLWLATNNGNVLCDKFKPVFLDKFISDLISYSCSAMEEDTIGRQELKCSLSGLRLKNARMRLYCFMVGPHAFNLKYLISSVIFKKFTDIPV